jgi:aldehyde dehydrogenase (NAD+)
MTNAISQRHRSAAEKYLPPVRILIGGEEYSSGSGGTYDHVDPATGEVQAQVPLAGSAEVDQAVAAARGALETWRAMRPSRRRDILTKFADLVRAHPWGEVSVLENGQPLDQALGRASVAADWGAYYASWADKIEGSVTANNAEEGFIYTVPEPHGVVAIIITWNAPLQSLAMKVPPALAAGNTVVIKPAEFTSFTAMAYVELAHRAGVPRGVINVLPGGADVGEALVGHPGIDKITFTGGPQTARAIMRRAADWLTPAIFELGGKGANIVFDDANLDEAIPFSVSYALKHAGQGCALPTRMLVQRSIYDDVVQRASAAVAGLKIGDPLEAGIESGPLINEASLDRVQSVIEAAQADGSGKLVVGGRRMTGDFTQGYFLENTLFTEVDPDSALAQGEIFGPVLVMIPFTDEAEAVRIANSTAYGLTNYIQSGSARRVQRLIPQLHSGTIGVNTGSALHHSAPFGGNGLSGFGREGGRAGLDEFLRHKTVLQR